MEKLMNANEAAEALCVLPGCLAKWRVTGKGPAFVRVGGRIAYHPDDVQAWIEARTFKNTTEANHADIA